MNILFIHHDETVIHMENDFLHQKSGFSQVEIALIHLDNLFLQV